jgi:hypothetical protein
MSAFVRALIVSLTAASIAGLSACPPGPPAAVVPSNASAPTLATLSECAGACCAACLLPDKQPICDACSKGCLCNVPPSTGSSCPAAPAIPATVINCSMNGGLGSTPEDLALFVISFHHDQENDGPLGPGEIAEVAQQVAALWPSPEHLLVALPNNPPRGDSQDIIGCGPSADCTFLSEIRKAYPGRQFSRASSSDMGDSSSAIIAGSAWTLSGQSVAYPSSFKNYDKFGKFTARSSTLQFDLYSIYAKFSGSSDPHAGDFTESALTFAFQTAQGDTFGNVPPFVFGDFNGFDGLPPLSTVVSNPSLVKYYTARSGQAPCQNVPSVQPFLDYGTPSEPCPDNDVNLMQIVGGHPGTLMPVAAVFSQDTSKTWLRLNGVAHDSVGIAFRVGAPCQSTCGPGACNTSDGCGGTCPRCPTGQTCTVAHQCCQPHCVAGHCNADGCGGQCPCSGQQVCSDSLCAACPPGEHIGPICHIDPGPPRRTVCTEGCTK